MHDRIRLLTLAAVISLAACADDAITTVPSVSGLAPHFSSVLGGTTYVLMSAGGRFKGDIAAQVAAAGGGVESNLSEIGVATAGSDHPNFAIRAQSISIGSLTDSVLQNIESVF